VALQAGEVRILLALALAGLVSSVLLTWLMRRWALAHGFVDQPGPRKIHHQPIALGGGIVIFWLTMLPVALAAALAFWYARFGTPAWLPAPAARHMPGMAGKLPELAVLIASAATLHILGLIDDKRHLGPWVKLAVQLAVALALATYGQIRVAFFIENAAVTTVLSVLWIIAVVNAFNFLDNMDGLSAGAAAICAAMILQAAWTSGQVFISALLLLLIAVLLGFLVFNFAPARIFMGDAGSLLIGMLLAVATVRTTYYHQDSPGGHWFATLMPLVVLAVPLYDFIGVSLIRLTQGKSPFVGDKQHFSHRLVRRGMSHRQAVLTIYLATACTGLGAIFLRKLSGVAAVLVFVQTLLIVAIIAILERPGKPTAPSPDNDPAR